MELKIETYKGAFGMKKVFVEIAIGIACCHFLAGCAKSEDKTANETASNPENMAVTTSGCVAEIERLKETEAIHLQNFLPFKVRHTQVCRPKGT